MIRVETKSGSCGHVACQAEIYSLNFDQKRGGIEKFRRANTAELVTQVRSGEIRISSLRNVTAQRGLAPVCLTLLTPEFSKCRCMSIVILSHLPSSAFSPSNNTDTNRHSFAHRRNTWRNCGLDNGYSCSLQSTQRSIEQSAGFRRRCLADCLLTTSTQHELSHRFLFFTSPTTH